ncbi:hypothetical protein F3Y22_tig00110812pilonHSYRG00020 [Hibiscus syriacus]|uniref:Uncharacterized protein n=1 Tax=Hibiscus syriacus TaxID=106335 RepID=A0A6A2ZN11_HIBSY|nr:uncharacterized protein LOC120141640 [Hibiscus syriacus]KAE8693404.1 hypothetical protein F3Y22_tig00110812pilonHSYRG00020 [Hibiscus syriacus]
MEDRYSYSKKSSGAPWISLREGDFEEEALKESNDSTSNISVTRHIPSAVRMIPGSLSAISHVGSCCSTSATHDDVKQQSAPVNIPDGGSWHDDDDDEHNTKFPPHEIIARRLARSQIPSFSVLEGVGRKLRGRDLRNMRNAVLTKTGFLE